MSNRTSDASTRPGSLRVFLRLTRTQFIPLVILPVLVGTALAYATMRQFNFGYLALTLVGVILLHLGANAIDDCYDYQNGVDGVADSMFPKDFGGWKPLPRGLISLRNAKLVSYLLFLGSLVVAAYLWYVVGMWSFSLGLAGVLLAIFYTAPPLKLDYRGYALGEVAILFAFGPIPVLGSYYVQTAQLSVATLLVSIPVGIMTVTILIDHDLMFYEVYTKSMKYSLGTVLGRANALKASLALTLLSYAIVFLLIIVGILPALSAAAPIISAIILARKAYTFKRGQEPPPFYLPFTVNGLLSNWCFALVLAISILV